jgi:3-phenylpropionate/trans-cinnamate dioxygenase ferredoxin subunit
VQYEPEDLRIAVCNVDGQFYAIEDVCTHDGGSLDQGDLEGDEIECPRHGARFNVRTGDATLMPAVMPVRTFPVKIEGERLLVSTEEN